MALSSLSERAVCRHSDLTLPLRWGEGWRWFICSASVDRYRLVAGQLRPTGAQIARGPREEAGVAGRRPPGAPGETPAPPPVPPPPAGALNSPTPPPP